ncbi:MAG TPA: SDR family oxidoreductase [Polyangiaceae bacterium]|nr:SDR family oxidoreductase [Polyangiaceae bacterium]
MSTSQVAPARTKLAAFDLSSRVILITGGSGLLGVEHAKAIADAGGTPVIADLRSEAAKDCAATIQREYGVPASAVELDVTSSASCQAALAKVLEQHGRLDGLVNNAAHNPKVEGKGLAASRFENFALDDWSRDLAVGLTGAFLVSQVFGAHMAAHGGGVIVNIASDLGVIAPDQRIYRRPGLAESEQPVKPVTYSVVKGGLVMLTKYLATYWAEQRVRVNALVPGGVYAGQPDDFVARLTNLIPMGRMANRDEYRAALVFLCSDASSYMTGSNLVVDGGRTCW